MRKNGAGYLCGLRSPVEKGEVIKVFLEVEKMEETL